MTCCIYPIRATTVSTTRLPGRRGGCYLWDCTCTRLRNPSAFSATIWNYVALADDVFYTLAESGFTVEAFHLTRQATKWTVNISELTGMPALSIVPTSSVVLVNLGVAFAALRPVDGKVLWVQTQSLLLGTEAFVTGNAVYAMVTVELSYVGLQGFALDDGTPQGSPTCVAGFGVVDGVLIQNLCEYRNDNLTFVPTALRAVRLASGAVLWSLPVGVATIDASLLSASPLIRAASERYIAVANVTSEGETAVIIDRSKGTVFRTLANFSGFASLSTVRKPRFVGDGSLFVALLNNTGGSAKYVAVDLETATLTQFAVGGPSSVISGNSTVEVESSLSLKITSILGGSGFSVPNATDVYAAAVVDLGGGLALVERWKGFGIFDSRSARCVAATDVHPAFEQYGTGIAVWNGTILVLAEAALYGLKIAHR